MLKSVVGLIVLQLLATNGLAAKPRGNTAFPYPVYYDTEGLAGAALGVNYERPLGTQSIWTQGATEPIVYQGQIGPQSTGLSTGTIYLWLTESQNGGTYAGWSAVNQVYLNGWTPGTHVPLPGSSIGFFLLQNDHTGGNDRANCVVFPSIADSISVPSLQADWPHVPENDGRKITVRLDYLKGNELYGSPSAFAELPGTAGFEFFQLCWVHPDDFFKDDFAQHNFGLPVPEGPVLLSVSIDGYSTDTVKLQMKSRRYHQWGAALEAVALDAAKASDVPILFLEGKSPPAEFVLRSLEWLLLGICTHFTNLDSWMDTNIDEVKDVADLVFT